MKLRTLSFTTFNLYNLNEPGLPVYSDTDGWDVAAYQKKIDWTARNLEIMRSEVFGFQELWHGDSLASAFDRAGLLDDYDLLVPPGHSGQKIVCAGAVSKDLIDGEPEWISDFPDAFKLQSRGDDAQTAEISVQIDSFSRPVLHFRILPRDDREPVHVFVCHFKSKGPTRIFREPWYNADRDTYRIHSEALGASLSTIRRTAEATALRIIITNLTKDTNTPVVVLGDINDGIHSNTMNILGGQPRYLTGLSAGGADTDLYTTQTLQNYRSQRDVYYTHEFNRTRESLDQILVSQEFYDNSRKRIWAFDGLIVANDHLNADDHKETGTNDHGIVKASFRYRPIATDDDD